VESSFGAAVDRRSTAGDLIELLKTGRQFRALGKADAYRLIRWMPMAVADLAGEWFESEPLRATLAAGGGSARFSDRGPPAAPPPCCCSARVKDSRSRTAGSRKAGPVPWPMRWPQPRVRPASKSEPARRHAD